MPKIIVNLLIFLLILPAFLLGISVTYLYESKIVMPSMKYGLPVRTNFWFGCEIDSTIIKSDGLGSWITETGWHNCRQYRDYLTNSVEK